MFLSIFPEMFDLKPLVGQIVYGIGTGNNWRRGGGIHANITPYKVVKAGPKSAMLAKVYENGEAASASYKATPSPSGKGYSMGFNSGVMLFKSMADIESYIQAMNNRNAIEGALRGMSAEQINKIYNFAMEIGAIK